MDGVFFALKRKESFVKKFMMLLDVFGVNFFFMFIMKSEDSTLFFLKLYIE